MAVSIKPINRQRVHFAIRGTSPMIQHKWSEKALRQIRETKAGRKTKSREACDPEQEFRDATYTTDQDQYGLPVLAFKAALISAAHKDVGIEKTLVRKSLFVPCDDSNMVIPMRCEDPVMREDYVTVGRGQADLRYRPEFRVWGADIVAEIDADMLRHEDLFTLINRTGFGVGIGEWRPEKGGEYGRFEIDPDVSVEIEKL